MKKEDFVKLGLDEEAAKKCADASTEELKGYIPKVRFDEVNNDKKQLELDVRERDTQLETLKNSTGDVETLKQQIVALQADNKVKDEAHALEVKQLKLDAAVSAALTSSKAKNEKAVKALLNLENAEIGEDGTVKGLTDQIKKLQGAEDSKFLFETESKPKMKGAVPGETGKEDPDGKVNFSKMGYDELAAYMAENPDAKLE